MKKSFLIILAVICSLCLQFPASAGDWKQQENQWYYEQDGTNLNNGWNQIDGKWYHIDTQACIFLVSDAVYSNTGMEWERSQFPQCSESYFSICDQILFPLPYTPVAEWIKH